MPEKPAPVSGQLSVAICPAQLLPSGSLDTPSPERPRATPYPVAYRLALLLTGEPERAALVLREVASAIAPHVAGLRDPARKRAWLLRQVREKAVGMDVGEGGEFLPIARLPEPARSAYALFLTTQEPPEELAEWLGLRPAAFGEALVAARSALEPGAALPAEAPAFRPWGENPPRLALTAQKAREKAKESAPHWPVRDALDNRWHTAAQAVELPEGVVLPEWAEGGAQSIGAALRHPAVLAIAAAALVVVGVVVITAMRRMDHFPGRDVVDELVETRSYHSNQQLEPVEAVPVGQLADWFMLKGFDDFSAPPELVNEKAVGGRVYKTEGGLVAEVLLERSNAILTVFRRNDSAEQPRGQAWYIYQLGDWAVATRGDEGNAYIIAFEGDSDDMPQFLRSGTAP